MAWDQVKTTIANVANDFSHLKVTTVVGDFRYTKLPGEAESYDVVPSGTTAAMQTDINLVQGDITNLIATDFAEGKYADVRQFHETQVLKAEDLVKGNVEALVSLANLVRDVFQDETAGA
jgi:hypothetical protein